MKNDENTVKNVCSMVNCSFIKILSDSMLSIYQIVVLFIIIISEYFLFCIPILAQETGVFTTDQSLIFKTSFVEYEVGFDGRNKSFKDIRTKKDYYRVSVESGFMQIKYNNSLYNSDDLTYDNGILTVQFTFTGVRALFAVHVNERYLTFTLLKIEGPKIEELILASLNLNLNKYIGTLLNVARDDEFGACILGLNMNTYSRGVSGSQASLRASCYPDIGVDNAGIAVIGCPADSLLSVIEEVQRENGLPHPTLSGTWNKTSPDIQQSYLFVDWTEQTIDSIIDYAKAGGFGYVMLYRSSFSLTDGHYYIREDNFRGGMNGLKATVKKIHDNGMKAGMHILVNWISKSDAYVRPVPHPGLGKDGSFTLAKNIDSLSIFIPTVESPAGSPAEVAIRGGGGVTLQIGDELISYGGVSLSPYGFSNCTRGVYGTKFSSHTAGDTVHHLAEVWQNFTADPRSTLVDTIAQRAADIVNSCEFDMIYFDGGETMYIFSPGWYYLTKIEMAFYDKFKREVLVQGSGLTQYLWNIHSRGACDDWAALGNKAYLDYHKISSSLFYYQRNLLPGELGWYGVLNYSSSYTATTPDEIEYACSKGLGYGVALSLETSKSVLDGNGRIREIFEIMKNYETLRLNGYFSESIRAQLRQLGQEHTLIRGEDGVWRLYPIVFHVPHQVKEQDGRSNEWVIQNNYSYQPLKLRLTAMWSPAPFGDPNNITVGAFNDLNRFSKSVSSKTDISVEKAGQIHNKNVIKLSVKNTGTAVSKWCGVVQALPKVLNLLGKRALGVWVNGDASGALLNIHLEDTNQLGRDYYVTLNFRGWQYFELAEPIGVEFYNYSWPYSEKWVTRNVSFNAISRIALYLNAVPPLSTVTCLVSEPEALKEYNTEITDPSIEVWGKKITFPGTLHEDQYLELDRQGRCRIFDRNGFTLKELTNLGNIPSITKGDNKLIFRTAKSSKCGPRAKISVITMGNPLTNDIPKPIIPDKIFLYDNYPNPFNSLTNIRFDLPKPAHVTVKVYNILGQEIKTILNKNLPEGQHLTYWDGTNSRNMNVSSGIYIYHIKTDSYVKSKKMTLTK